MDYAGSLLSGGVIGALIGLVGIIIAKLLGVDVRKYRDEKRVAQFQANCDHALVESTITNAFCEKCDKIFDEDEAARYLMRICPHQETDLFDRNSSADIHRCRDCNRLIYFG